MKKVVKKLNNFLKEKAVYTQKEMKHYLGSLNEIHGENLKGIREGFVLINQKLDKHTQKLNSHTEMIGVLMEDVFVIKEDVSVLKSDI